MDDDELITAIAAGDDVALRELFARHASWLAVRLRGSLSVTDTEDVLQETFLAVWRGAGAYRPDGMARGWLWGIARRQAALFLRRRGPQPLPLEFDSESDDLAEAVVAAAVITDAAGALGPDGSPDREVWRLMYVEDRPVAEVARLLGVPVGTVKSRAHRVRRVLRAALGGGS
jgi:RNA polymerase sigma-70 factor, ECF subfamily